MTKISELRWHARGGQGAMLAARTLARIAIAEGKYAQGMPDFGPERMGAPIRAYNRISAEKFSLYCAVTNPDVVVVLDDSLLDTIDVTEGINKDGFIIVNTNKSPSELRSKLNRARTPARPDGRPLKIGRLIGRFNGKIYTVDATGISITALGRAIPNTPMMGAIVKTTGLITLDGLLNDIKHSFGEKFSPKIVEGNLNAIKKGYDEVK